MDTWTQILNEGGSIDVVYTYFMKAFDSVPHQRPLSTLSTRNQRKHPGLDQRFSAKQYPVCCSQRFSLQPGSCIKWHSARECAWSSLVCLHQRIVCPMLEHCLTLCWHQGVCTLRQWWCNTVASGSWNGVSCEGEEEQRSMQGSVAGKWGGKDLGVFMDNSTTNANPVVVVIRGSYKTVLFCKRLTASQEARSPSLEHRRLRANMIHTNMCTTCTMWTNQS